MPTWLLDIFNWLITHPSPVIAALALAVSIAAYVISRASLRVSLFERREKIYTDTKNFISAWISAGEPDMSQLPLLVGAWEKSKFLCKKKTTKHIRKVWDDACQFQYLMAVKDNPPNHLEGDPITLAHELMQSHSNLENLMDVFKNELKI